MWKSFLASMNQLDCCNNQNPFDEKETVVIQDGLNDDESFYRINDNNTEKGKSKYNFNKQQNVEIYRHPSNEEGLRNTIHFDFKEELQNNDSNRSMTDPINNNINSDLSFDHHKDNLTLDLSGIDFSNEKDNFALSQNTFNCGLTNNIMPQQERTLNFNDKENSRFKKKEFIPEDNLGKFEKDFVNQNNSSYLMKFDQDIDMSDIK